LLTLQITSGEAFLNGRNLLLSQKQFFLLFAFMQNENQALSAESLYERVWGRKMAGDDNAVKVTVSRLRKKLKGSGFVITSERGEGYRFEKE
jgi:DNA-binding response OmpR family regulator